MELLIFMDSSMILKPLQDEAGMFSFIEQSHFGLIYFYDHFQIVLDL